MGVLRGDGAYFDSIAQENFLEAASIMVSMAMTHNALVNHARWDSEFFQSFTKNLSDIFEIFCKKTCQINGLHAYLLNGGGSIMIPLPLTHKI